MPIYGWFLIALLAICLIIFIIWNTYGDSIDRKIKQGVTSSSFNHYKTKEKLILAGSSGILIYILNLIFCIVSFVQSLKLYKNLDSQYFEELAKYLQESAIYQFISQVVFTSLLLLIFLLSLYCIYKNSLTILKESEKNNDTTKVSEENENDTASDADN